MVGALAVNVLLGKGIGAFGEMLKATKTGAKLFAGLEKAKLATTAKIVETISDEAATLAKSRLLSGLVGIGANTPLPPTLLKDLGIIVGNRLKNGGIKFAEFSRQLVDEFGEKVKPYLEKLYREKLTELGLSREIDELGIARSKLSKLTDEQLKANLDPTVRRGETIAQAQKRVESAQKERDLRGYVATSKSLGEKPPKVNIDINDVKYEIFSKAHTNTRHSPKIPLERSSAPAGTRTIEGRIYGDPPWGNRVNYSYKWLDESTMNRTINDYLEKNWDTIRWELATRQRIDVKFDAGRAIGEGYFNKNIGASNPPDAVYSKTSYVRIVIELDQTEPMRPIIVTSYPLGSGEMR